MFQECHICHRTSSQTHHVFGAANRKWSEKYDLKFRICLECHIEIERNIPMRTHYREIYQAIFEETHTREEFMQIFGRNYL